MAWHVKTDVTIITRRNGSRSANVLVARGLLWKDLRQPAATLRTSWHCQSCGACLSGSGSLDMSLLIRSEKPELASKSIRAASSMSADKGLKFRAGLNMRQNCSTAASFQLRLSTLGQSGAASAGASMMTGESSKLWSTLNLTGTLCAHLELKPLQHGSHRIGDSEGIFCQV